MGMMRMVLGYLLTATLLAAPLAGAQDPCAGGQPTQAVSADDHTERGMSHHAEHRAQDQAHGQRVHTPSDEDCGCCDQCSLDCLVSGSTADSLAAQGCDLLNRSGPRSCPDSTRQRPNPPPPLLFRPPILLS